MTPQQAFEYKRKWLSTECYAVKVYDYLGAKDLARTICEHIDYDIKKYAEPDDSHTVYFKHRADYEQFIKIMK